jgi:hypothetical protein
MTIQKGGDKIKYLSKTSGTNTRARAKIQKYGGEVEMTALI